MSSQSVRVQHPTVSSMSQQCRLCSKEGSERIFKNNDPDSKWAVKIKFTLNIEVKTTDSSQSLCDECKNKVEEIYDFKSEKLKYNAQHYRSSMNADFSNVNFNYGANNAMVMYGLDSSGKLVPVPMPMMPMMPLPFASLGTSAAPVMFPSTPEPSTTTEPQASKVASSPKKESVTVDDYSNLNALIDEVNTDVGSSSDSGKSGVNIAVNEKNSNEKPSEDVNKSDEKKDGKNSNSKCNDVKKPSMMKDGRKSAGTDSNDEESEAPPRSVSNRARRGVKRRGSTRRSSVRRTRPRTEPQSSTVTPARSLRARPQQKKIVDSDSDDGDFNPDDPDDPADPSYGTSSKRRRADSTSSSSSSSSSCDSDDNRKTDRSHVVAQILKRNKEEKEKASKRSCPNCGLTYKNWASYDDHVQNCKSKTKKVDTQQETEEDSQKLIKCIVCLKRITGKKALREHMVEHQVKKEMTYECKTCKELFPDKGKLICHNALSHRPVPIEPIVKPGRKKLHCEACNEDFENSGDLICHEVLHHKKK